MEEKFAKLKKPMPKLKLLFDINKHVDKRRYNLPACNEIAAVFVENDKNEVPPFEGITVHPKGKEFKQLTKIDRRQESMIYPLYFPTGKGGWKTGMYSNNVK